MHKKIGRLERQTGLLGMLDRLMHLAHILLVQRR